MELVQSIVFLACSVTRCKCVPVMVVMAFLRTSKVTYVPLEQPTEWDVARELQKRLGLHGLQGVDPCVPPSDQLWNLCPFWI